MIALNRVNVERFLKGCALDYGMLDYTTDPSEVMFNILISQHERIKVLEELNDE